MSINKKNEIAVIVSISIILTMIIAVAGSTYSNSVEKDKSYKLIQRSLLIYKNNPSIENLRKISNDLYQFSEFDYNNKILVSSAIRNINYTLNSYCQKDDCASYASDIENYNSSLKELNGIVSAVNRDGIESIGFICPRIATTSNNNDIVYECVQSVTATRVALIVSYETYKKQHGGFLRDNMYVENIGPILYEINNYDPYRGNYKTTAMIATYRSIGISGRDIYNANEKIKSINNQLEAIRPLYASAEYMDWIKVFHKTIIDIKNLEKAIGIKGNNEWVKKYLNSQKMKSEYKELYELGVIEDFESKGNRTPSKIEALNNFYGLKENNGKVKIGNKVSDVWFGKTIKYGHDDIYAVFIKTHNLDESGNVESCHPCAPKISVITYKKMGNEWKVLSKQNDFTSFGSWGETGDAKPEVFLLAENTATLLLDTFGRTQSGKTIFSFVNNAWQDLGYIATDEDDLDFCSHYDNPHYKCVKYNGNISVISQNNTNYPDLVVKRDGKYSDGSKVSNVIYKFDGNSYTTK